MLIVKLYRYAEFYIFNFWKTIYGNVWDVIGKVRFHRADSGGSRTYSFLRVVFSRIWMIRCFAVVNYTVQKFSFCSNFYVDVQAYIFLLHIFIDFKTVFISWNTILKLKSFIKICTFIIHKKRLTSRVAVNFDDENRYSSSIIHLKSPLLR